MAALLIRVPQSQCLGEKPTLKLPYNAWIAGGAARRWFTGEPQESDVDVFFSDVDELDTFIELNGLQRELAVTTDTYMMWESPRRIQAIKHRFFGSPGEVVDSFDFCLCQFIVGSDGTLLATLEAITSTLRRHLAVNRIDPDFALDSLRRAFKYAKAGYWPCIGTLRDLATGIVGDGGEDRVGALMKQSEISPGGGQRVRVHWD